MTGFNALNLKCGLQLVIETEKEMLVGRLIRIDYVGKTVILDYVEDFKTGMWFTWPKCIRWDAIKTVSYSKDV